MVGDGRAKPRHSSLLPACMERLWKPGSSTTFNSAEPAEFRPDCQTRPGTDSPKHLFQRLEHGIINLAWKLEHPCGWVYRRDITIILDCGRQVTPVNPFSMQERRRSSPGLCLILKCRGSLIVSSLDGSCGNETTKLVQSCAFSHSIAYFDISDPFGSVRLMLAKQSRLPTPFLCPATSKLPNRAPVRKIMRIVGLDIICRVPSNIEIL